MVVPDDDFVPLVLVNQDEDIGLVHHLDQFDWVRQTLALFLQFELASVVLHDFEAFLSGQSKELLVLV